MRALLLGLLDLPDDRVPPEEVLVRAGEWLKQSGSDNPAETAQILAATVGASDTDVLDRPALFAAWRSALELAPGFPRINRSLTARIRPAGGGCG